MTALDADDSTAVSGVGPLDHEVINCLDRARRGRRPAAGEIGQHIGAVAVWAEEIVAAHSPRVTATTDRRADPTRMLRDRCEKHHGTAKRD
jgi:hypothetical protein